MTFYRPTTISLGAFAFAVALVVPTMALADRPGTPNEEHAGQCNLRLTERPMVCVSFNNTASEPVVFDIEFTVDGGKIDKPYDRNHVGWPGERPEAVTHDRPFQYPRRGCIGAGCVPIQHYENFSSEAVSAFNGHAAVATARTGDRNDAGMAIPPQGFRIINLDYGVTYCFRFKARRVSDDMVSEAWSNWACATTDAAPPPKPGPPTDVTTEFTPGGFDWRVKPPKVVIRWGQATNAGTYQVDRATSLAIPPGDSGIEVSKDKLEARDSPGDESILANPSNPDLVYRVCAINISGFACATHSTHVSPGGAVEKPTYPTGDVTVPYKPEQDTNRPMPTSLPTNADQTSRRGGFGTEMSTPAAQAGGGSNACKLGFIWRKARPDDVVCVAPFASGRVAQENAQAASHVDPGGAYGPNSCAAGYVWREAYRGDVVCVTPLARDMARQENVDGPSHRADGGNVEFRDPR